LVAFASAELLVASTPFFQNTTWSVASHSCSDFDDHYYYGRDTFE